MISLQRTEQVADAVIAGYSIGCIRSVNGILVRHDEDVNVKLCVSRQGPDEIKVRHAWLPVDHSLMQWRQSGSLREETEISKDKALLKSGGLLAREYRRGFRLALGWMSLAGAL